MTDRRVARILRRIDWLRVVKDWAGCPHCGNSAGFNHIPRAPERPWKVAR